MKEINKRKFFHLALLSIIVLLQCLVIYFWYLETKTDANVSDLSIKMDSYKTGLNYSNKISKSLNDAQGFYKDYIISNNKASLQHYYAAINEMKTNMGLLHILVKKDKNLKKIDTNLNLLNSKIDSIIDNHSKLLDKSINAINFKTFDYKNILKSVSVDSIITQDSIARKGLMSRILDAISGKYNIKKEKLKVVISYNYHNELESGDVKKELQRMLENSNNFYKNQFEQSKGTFFISDKENLRLFNFNTNLFNLSNNLIQSYNESVNSLQDFNQKEFQKAHKSYIKKRNYIIVILIVLMLLFTLLLFYFTRLAFKFEQQLLLAQNNILKNLQFKNRIVGMISHEIRSPLSILSMYSKRLSTQIEDVAIKDVFQSMQYTTNTLLVLTNQILEYSKNEDKQMELQNTSFNLKEELEKIVKPLATLAESKGNKLDVKMTLEKNVIVCSDSVRIGQLFYNLVGNAVKFTQNGIITVAINEVVSKSKENITISASVNDTGTGIAASDLKNIFKEYYQTNEAVGLNEMGIGLGLKICKEIVTLFDGTIDVSSQLGNGTKVFFTIVMKLDKNKNTFTYQK